jgi:hypothetical protein
MSSDELYELALKELKEHRQVAAIWARALADSEGDKHKAVARYIKYRVEQVSDSFAPPAAPQIPPPAATVGGTATGAMQTGFDSAYAGSVHAPVAAPAAAGEVLGFEMPSPPPVGLPIAPPIVPTVPATEAGGWGRAAGTVSADPVPPALSTPPVMPPAPPWVLPQASAYPRPGAIPPAPPSAAPVGASPFVQAAPQAPSYAQARPPEEANLYGVMPAAQRMPEDAAGEGVVRGFACASHRAVARWFDVFLVSLPLILGVKALVAGLTYFIPAEMHPYMAIISQLVIIFIVTPGALVLDALIYSLFGNTPSKALLRIELYRDGRRLDGNGYFRRNVSIWVWAYACGLGCINLFLQIIHCIMVSSSGQTFYDQRLDVEVVCRPLDGGRTLLAVAMFIALVIGVPAIA